MVLKTKKPATRELPALFITTLISSAHVLCVVEEETFYVHSGNELVFQCPDMMHVARALLAVYALGLRVAGQ